MKIIILLILFNFYHSHASESLKSTPWSVVGLLDEPLDVSALACVDSNHCLIASDETRTVQMASLDEADRTLKIGKTLPLIVHGEHEADFEAIATDGNTFYAISSHALSRKGKMKSNRFKLAQIELKSNGSFETKKTVSLLGLFKNHPKLSKYVQIPLDENGLNIEGLAAQSGSLYIGLRAPVFESGLQTTNWVVKALASEVFSNPEKAKIELIELIVPTRAEKGSGIRDLIATERGFLVLTGPSFETEGEKGEFEILSVSNPTQGKMKAKSLGILSKTPNGAKAESLTLLQETRDSFRVLVLFDGIKNGGPVEVTLKKD